jgi:hypothetical protein
MTTFTDDAAPAAPPPATRLWWAVPAAAFLLLVVLALIIGPPPDPGGHGTSYDASDIGFRAGYLLLEELHYPVERSRQATGGAVRWVLDPTDKREQDVANLDGWVRRGGVALLAVEDDDFATALGLRLRVRHADKSPKSPHVEPASGRGVESLDVGGTRVEADGEAWDGVRVGGEPLVTIVPHGSGELWVLRRPEVLRNANLRHPGNAVLACRLAEAMLAERPGQLAFDEYYHGLRQRPGVAALLFRPPMLWVTLQALLLTALVLWYYAPRFGPLRPVPPPNRRSKEEYLDAIAALLQRKGDTADAFRTVQLDLLRRVESDLGLPAGTPVEETVREAARRRAVRAEPLLFWLTTPAPPQGAGADAFLDALHQLETARNEFFSRHPRPAR